jgi:hypothetical protein
MNTLRSGCKRSILSVMAASVLILAASPLRAQDLTFTRIEFPGVARTAALGINAQGQVVGWMTLTSRRMAMFLIVANSQRSILQAPGLRRLGASIHAAKSSAFLRVVTGLMVFYTIGVSSALSMSLVQGGPQRLGSTTRATSSGHTRSSTASSMDTY